MRHVVGIPHVNLQPLARPGIDDRSWHTVCVDWLVDVSLDELVGLWNEIARVEILAVDHGRQRAGIDLGLRDESILVAMEAHAIAPVLNRRDYFVLWLNRTVIFDPLDLQIDVALVATSLRLWMRCGN